MNGALVQSFSRPVMVMGVCGSHGAQLDLVLGNVVAGQCLCQAAGLLPSYDCWSPPPLLPVPS